MLKRLKRVETQSTGVLPGHVAERPEALPPSEITLSSLEERAEAIRRDQQWEAYRGIPRLSGSSPGRARSRHIGQETEAGQPRSPGQLNEAAPSSPHAARAEQQLVRGELPAQLRIKWRFPTPLRETIEINPDHLVSNMLSPADPAVPKPEMPTNPSQSSRTTMGKSPWVRYKVFKGMAPQAKAATKRRARQPSSHARGPRRRPLGRGKGKQKGKAPRIRKGGLQETGANPRCSTSCHKLARLSKGLRHRS